MEIKLGDDMQKQGNVELEPWQPIETAPKTGRQLILLKTPYSPDGCQAYSNTWWTAGFSVECKPTHWKPLPQTSV